MEYISYSIGESNFSEIDCIHKNYTYEAPLKIKLRLRIEETGSSRVFYSEEEIDLGKLPLMTSKGSFIISGAERVVVSQLSCSPGISFERSVLANGKTLHGFRIIPDRGTLIEVQFDQNDLLYVYLDRKRRRRKFLITTLLRALLNPENQQDSNRTILKLFYKIEKVRVLELLELKNAQDYVLIDPIFDKYNGVLLQKPFRPLTNTYLRAFRRAGFHSIEVINIGKQDGSIIKCLLNDTAHNQAEALKEIYKKLRPGEPPDLRNAKDLIKGLLLDSKNYDLGKVGRHMLNLKLGLDTPLEIRVTTVEDLVAATRRLSEFNRVKPNEEKARVDADSIFDRRLDDENHLGNRRVRTVGELLANVCRSGLSRVERTVRERMSLYEEDLNYLSPSKLVNLKTFPNKIKNFFDRNQLSQFKDQINPLSEMTHKRRLSALGPGGVNRELVGFEIRDVHPTHYGRICPIETPEGPNIGLINSLSTYAKIDEFGFLQSPYHPVKDGIVDKNPKNIKYLSAFEEERYIIAQANTQVDPTSSKLVGRAICRYCDRVSKYEASEVKFMDVSPKQIVSVAAGLIPFLEHDDANRALMGANLQRQAVPLLQSDSPLIGTGIEKQVAEDSRTVTVSESEGVVALADGKRIVVTEDGKLPPCFLKEPRSDHKRGIYCYEMRKFLRSNAGTCFNQKPIVRKGDTVKVGQALVDGACTDNGELALGRNILVAFMPWKGYNFEDAILISEKIVKEDIYTSIHFEEFEVTARDTKLGPEEITRDIPNAGEKALSNLDHFGIVRIGAKVKPGDILVGKVTPKGETDLAPEEKLLRGIFGEKAPDVKDSSLRVLSGTQGIVMDIKFSYQSDDWQDKPSPSDLRRLMKQIKEDYRNQSDSLRSQLTESLSVFLLGEKIPLNISNCETGDIIIPSNRKITKTLLRRLSSAHRYIDIPPSPVRIKVFEVIESYESKFNELDDDRDRKIDSIEQGDYADAGALKKVRVFIAKKHNLKVGDKMAGRHGNKGVVAKIVPEEDMPYLPDGTPMAICLNPIGIPSRMNVGQILETSLGWACKKLGIKATCPVFEGMSID